MRLRWWQSIRWRMALGSVLIALLATTLLAFTAIFVVIHYYSVDQKTRLDNLALDKAQNIGMDYLQTKNLTRSAIDVVPDPVGQDAQVQQHLLLVLDRHAKLVYPRVTTTNLQKNIVVAYLLRRADPAILRGDLSKLDTAVTNGLQGTSTVDDFKRGALGIDQPFVVRPIYAGGQNNGAIIGVLIATARTDTLPPFVSTVGGAVLLASLVIAVLAALAGVLFSQTITRPLEKMTRAAHIMASGNYNAQVTTGAPGELGELASTFNEMAAQLNRDVEELRQQELWRRDLIMNITHDLATPLTAIAGLGDSLVDGVNQSREDYEATGRIIVRETLRLRRLVKDLHIMAKVEAGALHPQRKPVRLAALVDEVLAVLAPEFERLHVEPSNAIAYNLPTVQADPDMLSRVFSNLCDNALHHTPAGGTVTIDAIVQGSMLTVSVTDTGDGIPAEALGRIFDRFYRADSSRQSSTGGSGLGLAIVQAMIIAHGGSAWAENVPGAGARIVFTLPLSINGEVPVSDLTTMPLLKNKVRNARLVKLMDEKKG